MPKVIVHKCPHCGKLFEDSTKYRKHLRAEQVARRSERKVEIYRRSQLEKWAAIHNIEMSIVQFEQFIIDNQEIFWNDAASSNPYEWKDVGKRTRKGVTMPVPKLLGFTNFDLRWSDCVSNTHSCPKNGVQNWGRDPNLPMGYPGWHGRVEWKCEWPDEFDGIYLAGDIFDGENCCIHTGTGGGGGMTNNVMRHGYDITMFADDWSGLAEFREKELVWDKLVEIY